MIYLFIELNNFFVCTWSHGLRQKKPYANVAVPPTIIRVPSQWPLARVSRQSHFSANDNDGNEMIPEAVHRPPSICLTAEENTSASRPSDKGCATSHRFKWGHLPADEVDRIVQHVRKGEGRYKGIRSDIIMYCQLLIQLKSLVDRLRCRQFDFN